jgi:membrane protease YdiL (CAAX protease family)
MSEPRNDTSQIKPGIILSLWRRLPIIVRAILSGSVLATVGTLPWALLSEANLKYLPKVPWSVPLMAVYLWLFWRYSRGEGWPRATSEIRKKNLRANNLSADVWGWAIFAGILGLVGLVIFMSVMGRLVKLPQEQVGDISHIPFLTLFFALVMGSLVAGIVEEASFRGYMQGPIERRHGPLIAILVTGILFGFAHFTHPEVTIVLMPFYLAVAGIYGALAYITKSILPGVVLHAGGDLWAFFALVTQGQSMWLAPSSPPPLIWETGADGSFWISLVGLIIISAVIVWAYSMLTDVVQKERESSEPAPTHEG